MGKDFLSLDPELRLYQDLGLEFNPDYPLLLECIRTDLLYGSGCISSSQCTRIKK